MNEPLWHDDTGPIKDVREGMSVVDVAGVEVGKVAFVRMGDPEAVTAQSPTVASEGLFSALVRSFTGGEPDTPRQVAEHLLRVGFAKVDGKGLLDRDTYVASDQIASVVADSVVLCVGWEELAAER